MTFGTGDRELVTPARPVPDRIAFAIEAMAVQPGSHVLEIGCGSGHAIALLAEAVGPAGSVLGIDRSPTQIIRARPRLRAGNASVRVADFPVGVAGSFDVVFGVNLPGLRGDDPTVPEAVPPLLKPGGTLWVFDEPPPGMPLGVMSERITALLTRCGYRVLDEVGRDRTVGVRAGR